LVTATTTPPAFDMGRVLQRTFSVLGRNAVPFLFLSFLTQIPLLALQLTAFRPDRLGVMAGQPPNPAALLSLGTSLIVTGLVGIAISFVLQAALAHGTYADLSGKRASLGELLRTGLREFFPLVGLAIVSYLGMVFGTFLLIVPGVMLALAWSVVAPVRVVEHTPFFATFGRSAALTRGHRWTILGLYLVYALGGAMLGFAIAPLTGANVFAGVQGLNPTYFIGSAAVAVVLRAVQGTAVASIYYELRAIKEGVGPEQLAAVFD
jgi:hypothetical protein